MNIKAILLAGLIPLVSAINAPAAKAIGDAQKALEDGHVDKDEAIKLVGDAIDVAISVWPEGAHALTLLKVNIEVDLPNVERTIEAFAAIGK